ncbi:MAG: hypothetical protein ACRDRN_05425 [Sciscionella sp.]
MVDRLLAEDACWRTDSSTLRPCRHWVDMLELGGYHLRLGHEATVGAIVASPERVIVSLTVQHGHGAPPYPTCQVLTLRGDRISAMRGYTDACDALAA